MTTELISLNEYRKNISTLWKKAQKENIKYVVLSHSKPIFEVNPLQSNKMEDDWDVQYTPANHEAWVQAQEDLKNGDTLRIDPKNIRSVDDFLDLIKS